VGGLEAAVGGLARAQVARGHDVRVVTLVDGPEEADGVRYVRLERMGSRRWPWARGLRAAVDGADVVHAHGLDGLLDLLVVRGVRPLGVSTHGGYFHTDRQRVLKELWLRTGSAWTLRRAAVWFTSEADRERLAPSGATGTVMPDGVDVERFARVERRPRPGWWLVLGRIDVHKGLEDLVRAVSRMSWRPVIEVVGPESAPGLVRRLQAEAARARVDLRFTGGLLGDELLEALGRAERAIFPSRYEGFGIAAIEAMAAGVPVVLSDIPAFRAHRGVARIVDFREPDLDALAGPLPDPSAAAAHARTFAWPARAEAWDGAYRRIA
jgi:alpha-1,3-mannosyltransferase